MSQASETIRGSFKTLNRNRAEAVELLRLALNAPRFDAEAIERMRRQITVGDRRAHQGLEALQLIVELGAGRELNPVARRRQRLHHGGRHKCRTGGNSARTEFVSRRHHEELTLRLTRRASRRAPPPARKRPEPPGIPGAHDW